jgi:hypothetical protein
LSRRTVAAVAGSAVVLAGIAGLPVLTGGPASSGSEPTPSVTVDPRLLGDDFEDGRADGWGDAAVLERVEGAAGQWALRLDGRSRPAAAVHELSAPAHQVRATAGLRVASGVLPRSEVLALRTGAGALVAAVTVGSGGTLGVTNGFTTVSMGVPVSLHVGSWQDVGLEVSVTGETSWLAVSVDGRTVETWATDLGDSPVGQVQLGDGSAPRGADLRVDDVAVERAEPGAVPATTTAGHDPVLFAAGDIACDPGSASFRGGEGTATSCQMQAVADLVLGDSAATTVAALGDVQYQCGGEKAFAQSYAPSWGRFLDITRPAVGNHEYIDTSDEPDRTDCDPTGTARGYFEYFGDRAGEPGKGYYSYDLGTWHVVVLNTTCSQAGGCHQGSAQERWLRRDLAAHPARCTLAYWHIPVWSSGGRANDNARVFTRDLAAAGADVVLTGHDHLYERFQPMDAEGEPDAAGIRAWVVGTGGSNHTGIAKTAANSAVIDPFTYGVLRMVLRDGSYDWTFLPAPGGSFTDTGTARCH